MQSVEEIANDIVDREGGFVNDPDDPGGATKFGVTIHSLRRLGIDLTGDGAVDIADVHALERADAVKIFIEHYFERPRIDTLPTNLQASVFDMYVNAGRHAVKVLQHLLCDMGQIVHIDGVIGPETQEAARIAHGIAAGYLVDAYGIARRNYYYRLADARPSSRKYARRKDGGKGGWIMRAESFIAPRYHLSVREHHERVAGWG
ncbi:holin-associated N-acetylmuramidase [Falsihalocynthiibacter sp. SS001]|uniref:holin-associated N-acetylmuramidase n=1 Tax=Falsihalocynthiibacter sp. SS001 TaxID=3349698 RepID=UPI0036D28FCD